MNSFWITAIGYVIFGEVSPGQATNLTFPENLMIGAGFASYQVEGAWDSSDKGESIWDHWTHNHPDQIKDASNADITSNEYYKYKEDVKLIKSLGMDSYRFSISWARVLPNGRSNVISKDGLQYYKNLTAELVANGITPVVTLYHWDHPQVLEGLGGWTNELMAEWFVSYARIIFEALGDSVKIWTTINEPNIFCSGAYEGAVPPGVIAPGKKLNGYGAYLCMHNMLKAHALAYHMYDEEFRDTQQGEVGIVAHCRRFEAANAGDTVSVEIATQFECGWVYHPIFIGDYPEIMKTRIAEKSKAQGYESSRLPEFSDEWISIIKGSADYLGINHYSSALVAPAGNESLGVYDSDRQITYSADPNWPKTRIDGLYVTPDGFYNVLCWIKDEYANPPVRVMENGYSDAGDLKDYDRISFHHDYLASLLKAVHECGSNVASYSVWSIVDGFEWNSGYTPKFGIFSVDLNDTERPRTPRLSASWWKSVLQNRSLQPVPTKSDSI